MCLFIKDKIGEIVRGKERERYFANLNLEMFREHGVREIFGFFFCNGRREYVQMVFMRLLMSV